MHGPIRTAPVLQYLGILSFAAIFFLVLALFLVPRRRR
jgi:hypothetical protein